MRGSKRSALYLFLAALLGSAAASLAGKLLYVLLFFAALAVCERPGAGVMLTAFLALHIPFVVIGGLAGWLEEGREGRRVEAALRRALDRLSSPPSGKA